MKIKAFSLEKSVGVYADGARAQLLHAMDEAINDARTKGEGRFTFPPFDSRLTVHVRVTISSHVSIPDGAFECEIEGGAG